MQTVCAAPHVQRHMVTAACNHVCPSCRACKLSRQVTLAMGVEKITIGSNIPAYEVGEKSAPAVIVLQVSDIYIF